MNFECTVSLISNLVCCSTNSPYYWIVNLESYRLLLPIRESFGSLLAISPGEFFPRRFKPFLKCNSYPIRFKSHRTVLWFDLFVQSANARKISQSEQRSVWFKWRLTYFAKVSTLLTPSSSTTVISNLYSSNYTSTIASVIVPLNWLVSMYILTFASSSAQENFEIFWDFGFASDATYAASIYFSINDVCLIRTGSPP